MQALVVHVSQKLHEDFLHQSINVVDCTEAYC